MTEAELASAARTQLPPPALSLAELVVCVRKNPQHNTQRPKLPEKQRLRPAM